MRVGTGFYRWVQQYGSNTWSQHADEILAGLRRAGYDSFEGLLDVLDGDDAQRWQAAFARNYVQLAGAYTTAFLHDPATQAATIDRIVSRARVARALGAEFIDANPQPISRRKTNAELQTEADGFASLSTALQSEGLSLVVHQHLPELLEDARELRYIIDHTPAEVGLCLDTDWLHRGGQDPAWWIEHYSQRLAVVHLRTSQDSVWSETLGDGAPDTHLIARSLARIGFDAWLIVELARQEATPSTLGLIEAHARSRAYVREIFAT